MTNHELRKEWKVRIADFTSSGQSNPAWCAVNQTRGHSSPDWITFEVGNSTLDSSDYIGVLVGEVIIEVKLKLQ